MNRVIVNNEVCKQCTVCKEYKPETTDYFYMRNKSKPEKGFQTECKKCSIQRTKNKTAENHDAVVSYILDYQKGKGRETSLKRWSKYGKENRERKRNNLQRWYKNNPERTKELNNKRRKKNHIMFEIEWENCKRYFNYRCAYDKLITLWAKVTVILKHTYNGTLTDDYYNIGAARSCVGRIPREAWLIHNLQYCKDEYWNEITKRGLQNSFTLWDETRKTA